MFEETLEYWRLINALKRFFILIEPNTTAFCILLKTLSSNLFCPSSATCEDFSVAGYLPITSRKILI